MDQLEIVHANRYLGDLLSGDLKRPEWVVEGLFHTSALIMVAGHPKTYKSLIVQELAVAVSAGQLFMDTFPVPRPRPVLYVQDEGSDVGVAERIQGLMLHHGIAPGLHRGFIGQLSNRRFKIENPSHFATVSAAVADHGVEVVIFDSFRRIHDREENSSESMRPVLDRLQQLRDEFGLLVVLVHHLSKSPDYLEPWTAIRGTTDIWASMDGGLFTKRIGSLAKDGPCTATPVLREGDEAAPFQFLPMFRTLSEEDDEWFAGETKLWFEVNADSRARSSRTQNRPIPSSAEPAITADDVTGHEWYVLKAVKALGEADASSVATKCGMKDPKPFRKTLNDLTSRGYLDKTTVRPHQKHVYRLTEAGERAAAPKQ